MDVAQILTEIDDLVDSTDDDEQKLAWLQRIQDHCAELAQDVESEAEDNEEEEQEEEQQEEEDDS